MLCAEHIDYDYIQPCKGLGIQHDHDQVFWYLLMQKVTGSISGQSSIFFGTEYILELRSCLHSSGDDLPRIRQPMIIKGGYTIHRRRSMQTRHLHAVCIADNVLSWQHEILPCCLIIFTHPPFITSTDDATPHLNMLSSCGGDRSLNYWFRFNLAC